SISVLDTLLSILLCVILVAAVLRVAFGIAYFKVYVVGPSMSSTLVGAPNKDSKGGDYVYAFRSSNPKRGDIVVIDTKTNTKTHTIIKRVIALGGDTVELKEGVLYLNGEVVDEAYVLDENNTPSENSYAQIVVPEGKMFCLGDNRDVSLDSRSETYGCMPVSWTAGVVADWSMSFKSAITAFNCFFDFTLPEMFGGKK
ncbi:MAG: signal peptidase I, partial [Clostridia bacterium]|nr:signal peptidase I [Clostridia bacterium]